MSVNMYELYSLVMRRHLIILTTQFLSANYNVILTSRFRVRWMSSLLSDRQQTVKIGNTVSKWVSLNGGLPQGSSFGRLIFVLFINELKSNEWFHKYVDDLTVSRVLNRHEKSKVNAILSTINQPH
jgi:hypothetical protein